MSDDDEAKREADVRTMAALLAVAVVATLFLGLIALILPNVLGVILIAGGLAWFGLLHYLIWGWWLGSYLRRIAKDEDDPKNRNLRADGTDPMRLVD